MYIKEDNNSILQEPVEPVILRKLPEDCSAIQLNIQITKSGIPALFESGGAYVHTGHSRIIATASGNKKRPLFIRHTGDRACGDHALLSIKLGDLVFEATRTGSINTDGHLQPVVEIEVYIITDIDTAASLATLKPVFYNGKRDPILAAANKALDYHCREPYYIRTEPWKE